MSIQQEQTVDLDKPDVFAWVRDMQGQQPFEPSDPPLRQGFVKVIEKTMGRCAQPLRYAWGVRETWAVHDLNGEHISTYEVSVACSQEINVETVSVVSVDETASEDARQAILASFDQYDPSSGIDPHEWARRALPQDAAQGFGLFDVRQRFRLSKTGALHEDRRAEEAIRRRIESGGVADGPQKYRCKRVSEQVVREIPEFTRQIEERSIPPGTAPDDPGLAQHEINQIAVSLASPAECDLFVGGRWDSKVGDLLSYPEFKIEWEIISIRIGCVEVALHLPVLYTRQATKQLWAFGFFPPDPGNYLVRIVESCALLGAGAGIVAGLAFANFGAALAAFKHVFTECFKSKMTTTIRCVVPGLALLTSTEPWKRF